MKWGLGLISLALWFWLGLGLTCSDKQYYGSNSQCCNLCPPGEELAKRCTDSSPTVCERCDENYYNDVNTYSRCKPCMDCDAGRGLQEIRPCQATSNTVCACLPGHAAKDSQAEKRCYPCPNGHFSFGGNMKCRPWTNCTAIGRKVLRSGKKDADTICDNEPPSRIPTQRTITRPTPFLKTTDDSTRMPVSSPIVVPINPGFVWILITFVTLLTVAGILVFLFFHRRTKKRKLEILGNGVYPVPCKDEEDDYRMPIQEEEAGEKSDFVKG